MIHTRHCSGCKKDAAGQRRFPPGAGNCPRIWVQARLNLMRDHIQKQLVGSELLLVTCTLKAGVGQSWEQSLPTAQETLPCLLVTGPGWDLSKTRGNFCCYNMHCVQLALPKKKKLPAPCGFFNSRHPGHHLATSIPPTPFRRSSPRLPLLVTL